eukprot:NODE_242_length_1599_cov_172.340645_g172_i0.p1 GENE.NODE_242_length_1599_cov_172.340645_g172_i0~~NODE_242_length_1599_cov_172.340645_g172_i0.p1  ORF type:complete len:206 (+),score=72.88 NODE_242_length_1599_cov_172.340645_g172_i0:66-683(+)
MGCTSGKSNSVHPAPVPVKTPEPPQIAVLGFGEESLDAFSKEHASMQHAKELKELDLAVSRCLQEQEEQHKQLLEEEEVEWGYVTFELEDLYDQAKLVDDLRRGVIEENIFIMQHSEEHEKYQVPFLPSPNTAAKGEARRRTQDQVAQKKLQEEMMDEFETEAPVGPLGAIPGAVLPALVQDGTMEDDWTGHRKKRKKSLTSTPS